MRSRDTDPGHGIELTSDQLKEALGGESFDYLRSNCLHPGWGVEDCGKCPALLECRYDWEYWHSGDSREDVKPENISSAFAEGRISGAEFFA